MSHRIQEAQLNEHLARRGFRDDAAAPRILRATLAVLGERLVDDEAKALADVLPNGLARVVEDAEYDADFGTEELFARIARRAKAPHGRALETAEIVLAALGECLEPERRKRLAQALPERAAEILLGRCAPDADVPPHAEAKHAPRERSLATGRPGSRHPLSDARPPRGHAHSVAANADPHGETKLSSARGTTQERFRETLAEGRPPGPVRPIGGARD